MPFATVVNCIDGRVQLPVIEYLKNRFHVDCVDSITDPAPVRILADQPTSRAVQAIFDRIDVSVSMHKSTQLAIVAHHDCAGNPVDQCRQLGQLAVAVSCLKKQYPAITIIGLWVDEVWMVREVK